MTFKIVLLVKPTGKRGLGFASDTIPLGLEYLAASIANSVERVNIVNMEIEKAPFESFIESFEPDLVGVTMSATDHNEGLRIAEIAKENGCATVLGGYHPTAIPDELLKDEHVDFIVRGEGEYTLRELVQGIDPRDILGLSYRNGNKRIHNADRPLIEDLDLLPFPARHLRRYEYKDHMSIDGRRERDVIAMSRGCWGKCSFCCEPAMNRGYQRFRSPENIMRELLEISSFHRDRPLYILATDPNFMGSPQIIDQLCDLLSKHKLDIRFSVLVRVDSIVRNQELVEKMCKSGILNYEMGIESFRVEDLKATQKGITLPMQEKAARILRENGAWVGGTFVIGLPDQTEEEIMKFPQYAKRIGLSGVGFGVATAFPSTRFYEDLDNEDLIVERDWTKYDEMHSVFKTKNLSGERLEELATYCHAKFWTLDTLIDHTRQNFEPGTRIPLEDFIKGIVNALSFAWQTTSSSQGENMLKHMRIAAEAGADPCVEEYTRQAGLDKIIEFSPFMMKVMGSQKLQLTICSEGVPVTSYVVKTTGETIEYVKAIRGRQRDSTISLDVNLEDMDLSRNSTSVLDFLKGCIRATVSIRGIEEMWCRLRLLTAIGLESTQLVVNQKIKALEKIGENR